MFKAIHKYLEETKWFDWIQTVYGSITALI